jgi:hypothetical protein
MPYCPDCHYEYQNTVSECPDCATELVEALPDHRERPLRLVELHRGYTPEVRILEEALRQEGIASLVRPVEPLVGITGDIASAMFSQLLISADDYEEHRRLIEDCLQFVGR